MTKPKRLTGEIQTERVMWQEVAGSKIPIVYVIAHRDQRGRPHCPYCGAFVPAHGEGEPIRCTRCYGLYIL